MNRTRTLTAAGLVALMTASSPGTAHAAPKPAGIRCGLMLLPSPTAGWEYAEVDAGPLAFADPADPARVYWGSITCTIQNEPVHGTTANDLAALTGSVTPGVASVAGTTAFRWEPDKDLYFCTQVNLVGGPTLYWNDPWGVPGAWSTSSAAECSSVLHDPSEPDLFDEVWTLLDGVL